MFKKVEMTGMAHGTWYNESGEHMRKLAIRLITWYQRKISPHSHHRCRHAPTCSAYAKTCYERFNVVKASFLTAKRILTCNPLFKPKYDPVPEKRGKKHRHMNND